MEFIGQENLIQDLSKTNARAILIQGPAHFGKKTLIRQLYKDLGLYVYEVSGSVSDFRQTLEFIKTQTNPICISYLMSTDSTPVFKIFY